MRGGHLPNYAPFIIAVLLASRLSAAQTGQNLPRDLSAAKLIQALTEPINPYEHPEFLETTHTRISDRDRALANSLVALGSTAIPDLDSALDQIARQGEETPRPWDSRWLLYAYAKIRGPKAYQRLRTMADDPKLRFLSGPLDDSLALALLLTSYVSVSRVAQHFFGLQVEPRYSLDSVILAWMQGNRTGMEEELGANARSSLKSLLAKRSWVDLEHHMWHGAPRSDAVIGYRFEFAGDWSQPEETLDQGLQNRRRFYPNVDELPTEPKLLTQFVDKVGNKCVKREIRFVLLPAIPEGTGFRYFVDDNDMEALLRTISECALHTP